MIYLESALLAIFLFSTILIAPFTSCENLLTLFKKKLSVKQQHRTSSAIFKNLCFIVIVFILLTKLLNVGITIYAPNFADVQTELTQRILSGGEFTWWEIILTLLNFKLPLSILISWETLRLALLNIVYLLLFFTCCYNSLTKLNLAKSYTTIKPFDNYAIVTIVFVLFFLISYSELLSVREGVSLDLLLATAWEILDKVKLTSTVGALATVAVPVASVQIIRSITKPRSLYKIDSFK